MTAANDEAPPRNGPSAPMTGSIAEIWRERARLLTLASATGISEDEWNNLTDQADDLETAVLTGPIQNIADAIAKLEAVAPAVELSDRGDGLEGEGLADVIDWLKGRDDIAGPA